LKTKKFPDFRKHQAWKTFKNSGKLLQNFFYASRVYVHIINDTKWEDDKEYFQILENIQKNSGKWLQNLFIQKESEEMSRKLLQIFFYASHVFPYYQ
jgi:hypothetical protein